MKRFLLIPVFAVAAMFANATDAQAGLLSSLLTFDGLQDNLQDNSVASVENDAGTTGVLDTGDVIIGMVRIHARNGSDFSATLGEMVVFFSAQVTGTVVSGDQVHFALGPTTTAGFTLDDYLTSYSPFPAGSIGAVLTAAPGTVNPTTQNLATALANLNNTSVWSHEATIGFAAGANAFGDTDFFQAQLEDLNGDGVISFGEYAGLTDDTQVGSESAGLTVLEQDGLPGAIFLPVDISHRDIADLTLPIPLITTTHELALNGTLRVPDNTQASNGWEFQDDTRVRVNPVPEPGSLLLLGIGAMSACGFAARRRRVA